MLSRKLRFLIAALGIASLGMGTFFVFRPSPAPSGLVWESGPLTILKIPYGTARATLEYDPQPKAVSAWEREGEEIVLNGAYFHEDYSPSGFLVAGAERIGSRKFDEDKSGLLVIRDGSVSLRDLERFPLEANETFEFALQSFPFLIKDGQPAVAADSGKRARRTAIGTDAQGNTYVVVVDGTDVSLYELMNLLIDSHIPFTHVLNLDGGPSTGLYAHWSGNRLRLDSLSNVPNVVRFVKSNPSTQLPH